MAKKKKKKKKKSAKKKPEQTDPPRIALSKFYPDGVYPEGEIQPYKDEYAATRMVDENSVLIIVLSAVVDQQPLANDVRGEATYRKNNERRSRTDL